MRGIRIDVCPKTSSPCWYCSIARASGAVTLLKPDPYSGMLVKDSESFNVLEYGAWCDNDGKHWVEDLKVCPLELKPVKPWKPWKSAKHKRDPPTKKWKVVPDGSRDRQRVEQVGQQRLGI